MVHLTKEEKTVLTLLILVVTAGSILHAAFQRFPFLRDIVNLMESESIYPKVDINTACEEELVTIPYIGEYTARNIVLYRDHQGPFRSVEEILSVPGIRPKNYEKFKAYLKVSLKD